MLNSISKGAALAVLMLAGSVTGAMAQSKWTGISVGAGFGAGAINHDLTIGPGPALPPGLFAFGFDGIGGEGVLGTVSVAADYQVQSKFVVGVFFDYDFTNIETDLSLSVPPLGNLNVNGDISLDNQWTIGGRLGYLATPDTLWYGLVGYTQASVSDLTITATGPINGSLSIGVPDFSGWTVGGGVETMFAPNWSLKAEYRYTSLSAESLDLPFGANNIIDAKLEPSIHTARMTLNYKFNWQREAMSEPLK